jgi:hypothetical protein
LWEKEACRSIELSQNNFVVNVRVIEGGGGILGGGRRFIQKRRRFAAKEKQLADAVSWFG